MINCKVQEDMALDMVEWKKYNSQSRPQKIDEDRALKKMIIWLTALNCKN